MGLGPAWQGGGDHKLLATDAAASAHNTTSAAERRLPNRLCTYCVHDPSSGREALARCRSCMVCVCCGRNSPACAQLGALPVRPCMPWRIQLQPVTRLPGATRATAPCLASSSGPASLKRSLPLPPPPPAHLTQLFGMGMAVVGMAAYGYFTSSAPRPAALAPETVPETDEKVGFRLVWDCWAWRLLPLNSCTPAFFVVVKKGTVMFCVHAPVVWRCACAPWVMRPVANASCSVLQCRPCAPYLNPAMLRPACQPAHWRRWSPC